MMRLPGIGGTLFPTHFLAAGLQSHDEPAAAELEARRRLFARWWRDVENTCGPATGLRALFDLVAMPLCALLGFRARDAVFDPDCVRARLHSFEKVGGGNLEAQLDLLLLPWSWKVSQRWRHATAAAGQPPWCLIVAPPFVSILDAGGHAFRRSADFRLPDAIGATSFPAFWTVCRAQNLGTAAFTTLVTSGARFQDAVRADLQRGVATALSVLEPAVSAGARAAAGTATEEALTLVYRILFLLFAESRSLTPIHHPRYSRTYSITALCRDASRVSSAPTGLWDGLAAITRLSRSGCNAADLIVQPFNGRLFARSAAPALESRATARPGRLSARRDVALAQALVALATRTGRGGREEITYADLGVEQLGAVYEHILEPEHRKHTGTFYTPQPLAEFVVRRTLAPLVDCRSPDEILQLRVVDPAMGSGAFLVAACRFLSDAYERALVDEGRAAETDFDAETRAGIRRLIASQCLAGVDTNPVAVQVARLSLWLATLARDKPLSFLDHQLRVGDSLVGASPDDLWRLSPAGAKRPAGTPLFDAAGLDDALRRIAVPWRQLRDLRDDTVEQVRDREHIWSKISGDRSPLAAWRAACDLWCARWFWKRDARPSDNELRAVLDVLLRGRGPLADDCVRARLAEMRTTSRQRRFFHWPLEFADLFYEEDGRPRTRPGFHAVIGNPPWEMVRGGDHADSRGFVDFIRESGLYPSCDRGHLNLYQPFLERSLSLVRPGGRVGLVLPWGLAADAGATSLRRRLLERDRVHTLVGLDNSAGMFPIHRGLRFMVLIAMPDAPPGRIQARLGIRTASELDTLPGVSGEDGSSNDLFPIRLDADVIRAIGGPALRIPDARRPEDLDWLARLHRKFPALGSSIGWNVSFGRELNATEDRSRFTPSGLPVLDGKHIQPFQVHQNASERCISEDDALRILPGAPFRTFRLAYRDVAGVGNRLTLIAAIIPAGVVTTHTLFCLRTPLSLARQQFLCGLFNSSTFNRIVRMLMGSHVTTGLVENLPVPAWTGSPEQLEIVRLASALSTHFTPELQHDLDDRVARMFD